MSAPHDDAMLELVAVYALGGIDATTGECAAVREHIAQCPICRDEYAVALAATAAIGLSASEMPPAALRDRILGSLPPHSELALTPISERPRTSWFIPAAVAAAIVIGAGLFWIGHRAPQQSWAAVCVAGAAGCHASGTVTVAGADRLRMHLRGLALLPIGKQYQAWLIAPGAAPKPEPVFSADERGDGSVEIPEAPVKGAVVAITVEPAGGSQKPTSKPFLIAKID